MAGRVEDPVESPLCQFIKRNGGFFEQAVLDENPVWRALEDDNQRALLLDYMQQCGIVVQLDPSQHRDGKVSTWRPRSGCCRPMATTASGSRIR